MIPELDETRDPELGRDLLKFQAELLYRRSRWLEVTAMLGLGFVCAVFAYLFADLKGGWGHTPSWEPWAGLSLGAALGLGLSRPFAEWLRLQARLVHVQLRTEEWNRLHLETSRSTAERISALADAGLSGEWRLGETDREMEVIGK